MFWLVLSFILHVLIFKVDVLFAVLLCIILQVDGVNNLLRGADVVHCVSTKVEEFLWSQTVLFFTSTHKIFRRLIPLLRRPSRICPRGIKIVYDSYTGNIGGKKKIRRPCRPFIWISGVMKTWIKSEKWKMCRRVLLFWVQPEPGYD